MMSDQVPLGSPHQETPEDEYATDTTAFINHNDGLHDTSPLENTQSNGVPDQTNSIPLKEKGEEDPLVTTTLLNNHANSANNIDRKFSHKSDHTCDMPLEDDHDDFDDDINEANSNEGSKYNVVANAIFMFQRLLFALMKIAKEWHLFKVFFLLAYMVYFVAAMIYKFGDEGSYRLICCTLFGILVYCMPYLTKVAKTLYVKVFGESGVNPKAVSWVRFVFRWVSYVAMAAFAVWTIWDNADNADSLRGLPGLLAFVIICILLSTHPRKIDWHLVFWGLGLQFLFAVCTLKYEFGRDIVIYIQDRLDEFFAISKRATRLLLGPETHQHQILLEAMPIGFMVGSTMSILFYLGAMQYAIRLIGAFFMVVLGTEAAESMSVAGGIFLDWTSALFALRPWLGMQSKSQLFAIVTSVFASLGGSYLAMLAQFQVPLSHILPAMVISAPATFAVCKLMVPETRPKDSKRNQLKITDDPNLPRTFMEAFQNGAIMFLPMFGNVIATAFAFVCGIDWLNNTFEWFGNRIGKEGLTMEYMLSYLLYPVAYVMGVRPTECRLVARLLGIRFLSSNLLSFIEMMPLVGNRYMYEHYMATTNNSGPVLHKGDDIFLVYYNKTLTGGVISERSQVITTFCLCGFSSLLTMAFTVVAFNTLVPKRRLWISKIGIMALIAGNIANCMTACFASLFY